MNREEVNTIGAGSEANKPINFKDWWFKILSLFDIND